MSRTVTVMKMMIILLLDQFLLTTTAMLMTVTKQRRQIMTDRLRFHPHNMMMTATRMTTIVMKLRRHHPPRFHPHSMMTTATRMMMTVTKMMYQFRKDRLREVVTTIVMNKTMMTVTKMMVGLPKIAISQIISAKIQMPFHRPHQQVAGAVTMTTKMTILDFQYPHHSRSMDPTRTMSQRSNRVLSTTNMKKMEIARARANLEATLEDPGLSVLTAMNRHLTTPEEVKRIITWLIHPTAVMRMSTLKTLGMKTQRQLGETKVPSRPMSTNRL
mmetsp:Transcript_10663/g.25755  ORF Transcript_10663/g.25755 Transcript_10663/m.25755 type:complete len:272 (+) Transcript_10663:267-1082(+)